MPKLSFRNLLAFARRSDFFTRRLSEKRSTCVKSHRPTKNSGAFDETRTHTTFVTTPSRWRVYQFHHEGAPIFIQSEALKHQRMVALYTKKYSCVCCCITHRHFLYIFFPAAKAISVEDQSVSQIHKCIRSLPNRVSRLFSLDMR